MAEKLTIQQELLTTDISNAEPAHFRTLVDTYRQEGMNQYDKLIVGEEDAKLMFLATLAIGGADASMSIVFGIPGTGKSKMLSHFERIVDSYDRSEIAKVDHREDLTGAELVGKVGRLERTTKRGEEEEVEEFVSRVKATINPRSKIVKFDEISRTSPIALNAAFEILQNGSVTVYGEDGEEQISEFDAIVAGMNHYGALYTHSADPALVSRIAYGVEVGNYTEGVLSAGAEAIWDSKGRQYDTQHVDIDPVISKSNLQVIQNRIETVDMDAKLIQIGKDTTLLIRDHLTRRGIRMGDPRMASQIKRMAQALSLLRNKSEVDKDDVLHAAQFALTAKLGLAATELASMGVNEPIETQVNQVLDQIAA